MRRMWPDDLSFVFENAEEVMLDIPLSLRSEAAAIHRKALKVRLPEDICARLWPLAEARYRLSGSLLGKAVTLIANNPHYHSVHPADGGSEESLSDSGKRYTTKYIVLHFLLDDVREPVEAA